LTDIFGKANESFSATELIFILGSLFFKSDEKSKNLINVGGRRGRGRMVVGFITTYVISAYHH
jgi:hypothetical protein